MSFFTSADVNKYKKNTAENARAERQQRAEARKKAESALKIQAFYRSRKAVEMAHREAKEAWSKEMDDTFPPGTPNSNNTIKY